MKRKKILSSGVAAFVAVMTQGAPVWAATTVQVGASGKTFASNVVKCAADPITGELSPLVEAGLYNPITKVSATVSLNGTSVENVTNVNPAANIWLADGNNTVVVALNKKTADSLRLLYNQAYAPFRTPLAIRTAPTAHWNTPPAVNRTLQ